MDKIIEVVGVTVIGFGILALVAFLGGIPLMLLWNWLMPTIFGLTEISFLQALGLSLMSSILFKGSSSSSK